MHGKIIKIHNPEILKQKRHKIFDYISVDMQYGDGAVQMVVMTIDAYNLYMFKDSLLAKGMLYDDIEKLCDLQIEVCQNDEARNFCEG